MSFCSRLCWRGYCGGSGAKYRPIGWLTGLYLVLSGLGRFLVEFVRINPKTLLRHEQCAGGSAWLRRRGHS